MKFKNGRKVELVEILQVSEGDMNWLNLLERFFSAEIVLVSWRNGTT